MKLRRCLNLRGTEQACSRAGSGFTGVFIAFLCSICIPASAAFFSAIGMAFLPNKEVIYPLYVVFAVVLFVGLILGLKRHSDISPLLFGIVGIMAIPMGRYIIESPMLTYTGGLCVIAATEWNLLLQATPEQKHVSEKDIEQLLRHTHA